MTIQLCVLSLATLHIWAENEVDFSRPLDVPGREDWHVNEYYVNHLDLNATRVDYMPYYNKHVRYASFYQLYHVDSPVNPVYHLDKTVGFCGPQCDQSASCHAACPPRVGNYLGKVKMEDVPPRSFYQTREFVWKSSHQLKSIYIGQEFAQIAIPKLQFGSHEQDDAITMAIAFDSPEIDAYIFQVYETYTAKLVIENGTNSTLTRESPLTVLRPLKTNTEYVMITFAVRILPSSDPKNRGDGHVILAFKVGRIYIQEHSHLWMLGVYASGLLFVVPLRIIRMVSRKKEKVDTSGKEEKRASEVEQKKPKKLTEKQRLFAKRWDKFGELPRNPIWITEFVDYVRDNFTHDSDGLKKSEWAIAKQVRPADLPCETAMRHGLDNRYQNILPYDETLVELDNGPDNTELYVNASWIPGHNAADEFIATQGPKKETVAPFWHMVMQTNSKFIVMLTKLKELGTDGKKKLKCNQYWPEKNKPIDKGGVLVTSEAEEKYPSYVYRRFLLTIGGKKSSVHQFHFLNWPDHDVPSDFEEMAQFLERTRKHYNSRVNDGSPKVIHCSAGVGRTGCYVILYRVIDQLLAKSFENMDLMLMMAESRWHRVEMVQVYSQYKFLHEMTAFLIERYKNNSPEDFAIDIEPPSSSSKKSRAKISDSEEKLKSKKSKKTLVDKSEDASRRKKKRDPYESEDERRAGRKKNKKQKLLKKLKKQVTGQQSSDTEMESGTERADNRRMRKMKSGKESSDDERRGKSPKPAFRGRLESRRTRKASDMENTDTEESTKKDKKKKKKKSRPKSKRPHSKAPKNTDSEAT